MPSITTGPSGQTRAPPNLYHVDLLGKRAGSIFVLGRLHPMLRRRRSERIAVYRPRGTRYSADRWLSRMQSIDERQPALDETARHPNGELERQVTALQRKLDSELNELSRVALSGQVACITDGPAWIEARLAGTWRKVLIVKRGSGEAVLGTSRSRLPRHRSEPTIADYLAFRLAQATRSE